MEINQCVAKSVPLNLDCLILLLSISLFFQLHHKFWDECPIFCDGTQSGLVSSSNGAGFPVIKCLLQILWYLIFESVRSSRLIAGNHKALLFLDKSFFTGYKLVIQNCRNRVSVETRPTANYNASNRHFSSVEALNIIRNIKNKSNSHQKSQNYTFTTKVS